MLARTQTTQLNPTEVNGLCKTRLIQSLTSLERKSRLANDLLLRSYLEAVATEISDSYLIKCEQSLNLPPQFLKDQSALAEHFEKLRWDGARTYFVVSFAADGNEQTTFYPSTQGNAADLHALNEAIAAWKLRFREKTSLDQTGLEVDERDPDNRNIFKPIAGFCIRIRQSPV